MRLNLGVIALVVIFLLLLRLNFQGLPFIPESKYSDAATSHWPAAFYLRQSVNEHGEFPLWRETIMAGQPFAANPLNKTAYPLQWLALIFEPSVHLNILILLHLFIAGWGMWRWARMLEIRDEAALLSALAYALSPKLIAHLGAGHLDLVYALAWWPWLMGSVIAMIRTGDPADRPYMSQLLSIGIFAGLLFLADVRLSLFALALAVAYGLWEMIRLKCLRISPRFLAAGGLFLLLTLSVIVSLLAWRPYLSRAELTLADAGLFSLEAGNLIGLVLPPHGGNPETIAYLGLPVLILAGIAVFSAPRKHAFWLVTLLFAIFYALGANSPLWSFLVSAIPFLLWFRVPSRAWLVVVLIACLLAGYGLQTLMKAIENLRRENTMPRLALKRLATAGFAGASLFCGGFTLAVLTDLEATIGIGVILVGLSLGVILILALYSRLSLENLAIFLILVAFVDFTWTGRTWLEWRGPDQWLTHQQALVDSLVNDGATRIYSPNYTLEQQVAAGYGLQLFGGVDPFQVRGVVAAIEQGSGIPVTKYSVVLPPLDDIQADDDILSANRDAVPNTLILAEWGVSHVVATYPIQHERLRRLDLIDGVYIYANQDFTRLLPEDIPSWPSGWSDLPDSQTINSLNQITLLSAILSGLSFFACLGLLMWRKVRKYG
jgi:hypothetical protein